MSIKHKLWTKFCSNVLVYYKQYGVSDDEQY